jgi:hypothetical protein
MILFDAPGKENTKKVIEIALKVSWEKNINDIVFPSASGYTASFFEDLKNKNLVCVTHVNGFVNKGENEMPLELREKLINKGIKVLTTTHVLSGAERGLSRKFGGIYPVEIVANTLRMFGQGTKVAVEIAIMALDAGLIPYGKPVISLGGTEEGVDTSLILYPSHASSLFETKIVEILCKPANL